VIVILSAFGLSSIKFCKSRELTKVCKIKLNGLHMTEDELLQIINTIELVFHLANHSDGYRGASNHLGSLLAGDIQQSGELFVLSPKEQALLLVMNHKYHNERNRMIIKKKAYSKLSVLEI